MKRLTPVYEKRRALVKTIPKFWAVALNNNSSFGVHVQHTDDQKALLHLEDVWVARDEVEPRAFTLEFHFSENPYFSDKVLKKEYKYVPPPAAADEKPDEDGLTESALDFEWERDVAPQKIKIDWKSDDKNLTKLYPLQLEDGDVAEEGSFFNLFETETDHFDLGLIIANDIFPEAIQWFTGEATSDELDVSDEDDSEDEDDDDDDAEEIDLEKPRPKKQKTSK